MIGMHFIFTKLHDDDLELQFAVHCSSEMNLKVILYQMYPKCFVVNNDKNIRHVIFTGL